jgi:plastocyanin
MLAQAFLLVLLPLALAQGYGGSGGSSTSSTSTAPSTVAAAAASATPSSDSDSDATSHNVDVGEDGFVFTPATLKAAVGDTVNFHFYPLNHSVTQSSFDAPCTPLQAGIFSGFHPSSKDQAVSCFPSALSLQGSAHLSRSNWLQCNRHKCSP